MAVHANSARREQSLSCETSAWTLLNFCPRIIRIKYSVLINMKTFTIMIIYSLFRVEYIIGSNIIVCSTMLVSGHLFSLAVQPACERSEKKTGLSLNSNYPGCLSTVKGCHNPQLNILSTFVFTQT